jgi:hypothetical protein
MQNHHQIVGNWQLGLGRKPSTENQKQNQKKPLFHEGENSQKARNFLDML